jgi:hypothetical protein
VEAHPESRSETETAMTTTEIDFPKLDDLKLRALLTDMDPSIADRAKQEQAARVRRSGGTPRLPLGCWIPGDDINQKGP